MTAATAAAAAAASAAAAATATRLRAPLRRAAALDLKASRWYARRRGCDDENDASRVTRRSDSDN